MSEKSDLRSVKKLFGHPLPVSQGGKNHEQKPQKRAMGFL
jgi:hypothetical protein